MNIQTELKFTWKKEYQASWGEVLEDISYREGDSELIDVLWEIAKNYAIKEEVGE